MKTSPRLRRPPIPSCRRSKSTSAPIRKSSKCSRQARELIALRSEVATLRAAIAALRPSAAPIATEKAAERAAAKEKLFAEIDAAKAKHVEFVAREAIDKPERDRKQAEYEAQIRGERLAHSREVKRKWYAANPERVREQKRISEKKWWDVLTPEEKEAHLEKRRARSRINSKKRRAANPEKAREEVNAWRAANRERANASRRAWAAANPAKVKAQNARRREKSAAARLAKQINASVDLPEAAQ